MTRKIIIHNHVARDFGRDASPYASLNIPPKGVSIAELRSLSKAHGFKILSEQPDVTGFVPVRYPNGLQVMIRIRKEGRDRSVRDATQAYEVKVRRIATESDFTIRLFAVSQEDAERRAKERARSEYRIPPDKYRELERNGTAVFRIVSSKLSENQSRPIA